MAQSRMNPSQLIAWLMCLLLAFFATIIAMRNAVMIAQMQRRTQAEYQADERRNEILAEMRDALNRIAATQAAGLTTPAPADTPAPNTVPEG